MKNQIDLQQLVFSVLILFMFSCCQNENPCPTCFKDIVRCKVNGKEWVSYCVSNDPLFGCKAVRCYYYYNDDGGLDFSASFESQNGGIILDKAPFNGGAKKGINIIRPSEVSLIDRNFVNTNNCTRFNIIDSLYYNYIQLKVIDTTNFFIEGSFSFKTYNLC